jgi:hypothetical protein
MLSDQELVEFSNAIRIWFSLIEAVRAERENDTPCLWAHVALVSRRPHRLRKD